MSKVVENFLKYVAIDTQSEPNVEAVPSTEKQRDLAKVLVDELVAMGAADVHLDEHCYVYATIPSNVEKEVPVLAFIAHMDTSDAVSGKNVKARIIKNYDGSDIVLNKELGFIMHTKEFPALKEKVGEDLIVTDGTTLLGADDKAGVAEIMAMAEYLLNHPEIPHGTIKIGFTPDEEVGRGVDFFDVEGFGADFGYTVDGGEVGELEYENFNASNFKIIVKGKSIHPGSAKGIMKNSLLMGMEFHRMLPEFENPAYTEGYEGFYHLESMEGGCDETIMEYIIRDHDAEKFDQKVEYFKSCVKFLNKRYGEGSFTIEELIGYRNMKEMVEPHMHLIDHAKEAMESLGIVPNVSPIRGGTDGARLSYMGLPCPNLCAGGHNGHGRYEFVSVQSLEKCVEIILKIIEIYTNQEGK